MSFTFSRSSTSVMRFVQDCSPRMGDTVPQTPGNTDIFDKTGAPTGVAGLLTSTTTTSRQIQFALKLIW
jgi:hypothetical protein